MMEEQRRASHFLFQPSKGQMHSKLALHPCLLALALHGTVSTFAQQAAIPAGVPLRIQVDKRYPLKVGTKVEGHLIAPVFLVDHQVLPVNTHVSGSIVATHPADRGTRTDALLNGDFTPLATPELRFDQITLPDGTVAPISTQVFQRDAAFVRMKTSGKKPTLTQQAKDQINQRKQDALDQIAKPGKGDRFLRILYGQLPYHPQKIWPGTQFDADLTAPLQLSAKDAPSPLPVEPLGEKFPTGAIEARITDDLTSSKAKQGDAVHAVLTKPLLDPTHAKVLLPEGTQLEGSVVQAKAARWWARNGKLRFTFRQIELPPGFAAQAAPAQPSNEIEPQSQTQPSAPKKSTPQLLTRSIHGQLTASEADKGQSVTIDSEGGAQATGGKNKYLAPLALGLMAAASGGDGDNKDGGGGLRNGVVSNGFGIVIRVVTLASSNRQLAQGFAYFALSKSVYKRWISKGKEITFPKDTRVEIELSER